MIKNICLLTLFVCYQILGQQLNTVVNDDKGQPMLLGKTNKYAFTHKSFNWFDENYDKYLTNTTVINQIKDSLQQYNIQVFYGSWCGDSKRELPKFYKVLTQAGFPEKQLEMIAVDKKQEAYKQSPGGEEKTLNIHRVPTFIFYKNNKEVNRIVEFPKEDFERDILKIVKGENYFSNYRIVEYLNKLMQQNSIEELTKMKTNLTAGLSEFTFGSRELNTYGYVLLHSKQLEKALFVFELNASMYPYKSNVYDSLGEAYYTVKNYEKALESFNHVLRLKPNDENALNMIKTIQKEIN